MQNVLKTILITLNVYNNFDEVYYRLTRRFHTDNDIENREHFRIYANEFDINVNLDFDDICLILNCKNVADTVNKNEQLLVTNYINYVKNKEIKLMQLK